MSAEGARYVEQRIRNIAVGLIVRSGHALVEEYLLIAGHHRFVRAIGGGIDFGERAADAVRREFREELGVELTELELLAVTENLFTIAGRAGHEIVHVFAVRCPELEGLPLDGRLAVLDGRSSVGWHALRELRAGLPPLYPDGMIDYAELLDGRHRDGRG